MERLQTSARQRELLERTGLSSVEELMYADLRRSGWEKGDAFYAVYRDSFSAFSKGQQRIMIKKMEESPAIKARMNQNGENDNKGKKMSIEELAKETSKEKVLSDLVMARNKMAEGTKEWIDTTRLIAEYAKIKDESTKIDKQLTRYYLPAKYPRSCKDCLIYINKRKNNDKDLQD